MTLAVCVEIMGGCGRHGAPPPGGVVVAPKLATTAVIVRNHQGSDLRVYVVTAEGKSHRLGIAPRLGDATLVLPRAIHLPAEMKLVVIPLSHDEPQVTGTIVLNAGTHLVFTVASDASMSTLTRRP